MIKMDLLFIPYHYVLPTGIIYTNFVLIPLLFYESGELDEPELVRGNGPAQGGGYCV